jgi:hypothetical protein
MMAPATTLHLRETLSERERERDIEVYQRLFFLEIRVCVPFSLDNVLMWCWQWRPMVPTGSEGGSAGN